MLTVDRWADVDVEGGEEFLPTADIPILSACELRRQTVPLLCSKRLRHSQRALKLLVETFAKVLNFFVNGAQASITALAQDDEGKVILKITCLEVPAPLRIYDLKGATIYATGMMESKGNKPESSIYATRLFRHPLRNERVHCVGTRTARSRHRRCGRCDCYAPGRQSRPAKGQDP